MSNRVPSASRNCRYCGKQFSARGVTSHETRFCKQRPTYEIDTQADDSDAETGEPQEYLLVLPTSDILTLLVLEQISESWIQTGRTRLNRGEQSSGDEEIMGFEDAAFDGQ